MKTIQEIINNYKIWGTPIDDRFGKRLCQFLTVDQVKEIGFEIVEKTHRPKKWTRRNILAQLKKDVEFGFEKALYQRSISSSLMFYVVLNWNRVLEEGLENWNEDNYRNYGLPLFKATAVKYGWDNPIGDDSGDESKYIE